MPTSSQPISEKEKSELMERINRELRHLHILCHMRGYYYLAYILLRVVLEPSRILLITKDLYPDTGRNFDVSSSSVERAMRTAITYSWMHGGRETLDQMADCHLIERPTNTEFIGIVADYIRRTR